MNLVTVPVEGFSTQRLAIPPHWTVDVHQHYVPLSSLKENRPGSESGTATVAPKTAVTTLSGPESFITFNTARVDRLVTDQNDHQGSAVIYLTEAFVPRDIDGERATVEGIQGLVKSMPACSPSSGWPEEVSDSADSGSRTSVQEVVQEQRRRGGVARAPARSIAGKLCRTHRIFLIMTLQWKCVPGKAVSAGGDDGDAAEDEDGPSSPAEQLESLANYIFQRTLHMYEDRFEDLEGFSSTYTGVSPSADDTPLKCAPFTLAGPNIGEVAIAAPRAHAVLTLSAGNDEFGDGGTSNSTFSSCSPFSLHWNSEPSSTAFASMLTEMLGLEDAAFFTLGHGRPQPLSAAVATFSLATSLSYSVFNYLSVDKAFEEHVRRGAKGLEVERIVQASPRFVPNAAFLLRVEQALTAEEGPAVVARSNTPTVSIPERRSYFLLHERGGKEHYLLCLFAPRVQSDRCVVLSAAIQSQDLFTTSEEQLVQWVESTFHLQTPHSCMWGDLATTAPFSKAAAVACQGKLVVQIPSDGLYMNTQVLPTASQCFTSLGALTVVSPATGCLAPATATFTLRSEGRGASDYLDYVISEYQYNLGVKNVNNVAARSEAARQPGTFVVRGRTKTRLDKRRESCQAFLDVGSGSHYYVCAQECDGVGQLLVIECNTSTGDVGAADAWPGGEAETTLLKWISGIRVGVNTSSL